MSYEIRIERYDDEGEPGEPITLEEWKAAVAEFDNLRVMTEPFPIYDSEGEIAFYHEAKDGDLAILIGTEWLPAMKWDYGSACFLPSGDFGDPDDPLRATVSALARKLNAKLVGENDEFYD